MKGSKRQENDDDELEVRVNGIIDQWENISNLQNTLWN